MKTRYLPAFLVGIGLAAFALGGYQFYASFANPAIHNYTLILASGQSTTIGAAEYHTEGPCVVFTRPGRKLAICNEALTVMSSTEEQPAPPTQKKEAPVGPSRFDPNSNLQAEN